MRYVISEKFGSVFWKENNEILQAPLWADGRFDTDEGGQVESWDDTDPGESRRIEKLLGHEI
jgi:hypothetical protein